jgi:hypothetical protein
MDNSDGKWSSHVYSTRKYSISWLSEIWESLDVNIIIESFAKCITSSDSLDFYKKLHHFAETNALVEDIIDYDGTCDLVGFVDCGDNEDEYTTKAMRRQMK